jgi:hypothetical protein
MQVILTPTAVADMFGPGLNGFVGSVPGPPTELSAEFFNSIQMELVNVLVGQSIALDGLQFDQLKQAFDNYVFLDPTIASTLTIPSGAVLNVQSGGTLQCDAGSTATFDTITCASLLGGSGTFTGNVSAIAGTFGGTLTANGSTIVNGTMSVVGASGGALTSDPTAVCTWNGTMTVNGVFTSAFRTKITSTTSLAAGDLSVDASNNLRWRDNSATKFMHVSASGWVKGYGQSDSLAVAASATLDTAVAVAPLATADMDVEASCWVSRTVAGSVTVALDEVGGLGQIGTSGTFNVPATAAGAFSQICFSRKRTSATTTPRIYRLTVTAGAGSVTVVNARITVTPTS